MELGNKLITKHQHISYAFSETYSHELLFRNFYVVSNSERFSKNVYCIVDKFILKNCGL